MQVHSEHDAAFKALNSEMVREAARIDAAATAGGRRLVDTAFDGLGADEEGGWLGGELLDAGSRILPCDALGVGEEGGWGGG